MMRDGFRIVTPPVSGHNTRVIDPLVAQRIKRLRDRYGWTQKQLAAKAGVAPNTVGGIENGRQTRWDQFQKIARALGTTPEAIQRGDETHDEHPLLKVLNDEDLRIGKRFHDAETRIRTLVEGILTEGLRHELVSLANRIAGLDPKRRGLFFDALTTWERAQAEERAAKAPAKK